ncbi:winged helix-turn-helix domain-containing protein [Burkholderia arboris]|uniref:winged helix-turn-helix domain-containing protein n=1 Tax=Burkholderia arboris TaxID=488730 RepID=UPI001CF1303E|nr:winged helix-turn-helix domain-containing protein [Burkholderia arboris]MCA8045504.1 winged helix-turn-helix domain-containing protein [Burkholderia arboris]
MKIIEFVKENPGIHAGEIARRLGKGRGGSTRETIRHLIADGYLAKGETVLAASAKGHAVHPLKYTGKEYESGYDTIGSKRMARIQQRIVEDLEQETLLNESILWAGKAIRAMVDAAQVAA